MRGHLIEERVRGAYIFLFSAKYEKHLKINTPLGLYFVIEDCCIIICFQKTVTSHIGLRED